MAASAPCLCAGCSPPSQGVLGARFSASQPERSEVRVPMAGLRTRQREAASARCHVAPAFRGGLLFARSRGQRGICFSPLYLGQTLVQILPIAQHEYINAYDTDSWRETIRTSHEQSADHMEPDPPSPTPEPAPAPSTAAASDASRASD